MILTNTGAVHKFLSKSNIGLLDVPNSKLFAWKIKFETTDFGVSPSKARSSRFMSLLSRWNNKIHYLVKQLVI